jgi:sugar phosphate isomerase/epimerase
LWSDPSVADLTDAKQNGFDYVEVALNLLQIIENYPDASICFDTNHYFKGTSLDFVRKVGYRIASIHVSDYDGVNECHWIPGDGIIPWGELVHHIKSKGYKGVFMYETTKDKENEPVSPQQLANSFKMIEADYAVYAQQNN